MIGGVDGCVAATRKSVTFAGGCKNATVAGPGSGRAASEKPAGGGGTKNAQGASCSATTARRSHTPGEKTREGHHRNGAGDLTRLVARDQSDVGREEDRPAHRAALRRRRPAVRALDGQPARPAGAGRQPRRRAAQRRADLPRDVGGDQRGRAHHQLRDLHLLVGRGRATLQRGAGREGAGGGQGVRLARLGGQLAARRRSARHDEVGRGRDREVSPARVVQPDHHEQPHPP